MTANSNIYEYQRDNFTISTNPDLLDIEVIQSFLSQSYWRSGVPKEVVLKSIQNSFCFGLYDQGKQIGFAGLVTDFTHFAYLQDVFVLPEYQGRGLGTWLVESVLSCPALQGVGRILLGTRDAHALYRKFGFHDLSTPERWLEKRIGRPWFKPLS